MQAFNNLHYEHHLHTYPAKSSKTVQSRSIVYLSNINRWTILVLYNFTVFCQEMHSCNYGVQNKPWEPLVLIHLLSDWLLITSIVYYILPMWGHVTRLFLTIPIHNCTADQTGEWKIWVYFCLLILLSSLKTLVTNRSEFKKQTINNLLL